MPRDIKLAKGSLGLTHHRFTSRPRKKWFEEFRRKICVRESAGHEWRGQRQTLRSSRSGFTRLRIDPLTYSPSGFPPRRSFSKSRNTAGDSSRQPVGLQFVLADLLAAFGNDLRDALERHFLFPSVGERAGVARGRGAHAHKDGRIGDGLEHGCVAKINEPVQREFAGEEAAQLFAVTGAVEFV